jgi:hypothetical protein
MSQCSHKNHNHEKQRSINNPDVNVLAVEMPRPGERKEEFSRDEVLQSLVAISFDISSMMTQLHAPEGINTLVSQISKIAIIKEFAKYGLEEPEYRQAAFDFANRMVDMLEKDAPEQAARVRELIKSQVGE